MHICDWVVFSLEVLLAGGVAETVPHNQTGLVG
jgi:hypothetical protein